MDTIVDLFTYCRVHNCRHCGRALATIVQAAILPDMVDSTGQQLPSTLKTAARWVRLGESGIPAMLVHPDWEHGRPAPVMIWMHGRTVNKELDPGRYLRWLRSGIGVCAVDLPGHGERYDESLQDPGRALDVVLQMLDEIDEVTEVLEGMGCFDSERVGIGGMSAGGMVTLARLCREHSFVCASVEATSGSWEEHLQGDRSGTNPPEAIAANDPIQHLDSWREIPIQALHSIHDEWVAIEGQSRFIDALRNLYSDPELIEFIRFERTGAPNEHAGFGTYAAEAKNRQVEFLRRYLLDSA